MARAANRACASKNETVGELFVLGPYIMKKLGNPGTIIPRNARGSPAHTSCRSWPPSPVTFSFAR